jgi:hypothetical protein
VGTDTRLQGARQKENEMDSKNSHGSALKSAANGRSYATGTDMDGGGMAAFFAEEMSLRGYEFGCNEYPGIAELVAWLGQTQCAHLFVTNDGTTLVMHRRLDLPDDTADETARTQVVADSWNAAFPGIDLSFDDVWRAEGARCIRVANAAEDIPNALVWFAQGTEEALQAARAASQGGNPSEIAARAASEFRDHWGLCPESATSQAPPAPWSPIPLVPSLPPVPNPSRRATDTSKDSPWAGNPAQEADHPAPAHAHPSEITTFPSIPSSTD